MISFVREVGNECISELVFNGREVHKDEPCGHRDPAQGKGDHTLGAAA
jgi:hypothetical protein